MTILGTDGKRIGGRKVRVMNGPLAGTVFTLYMDTSKFVRIPLKDDDGTVYWLMFEKQTGGLFWRGWSTDGETVDAPWKSVRAKQITNMWRAACAKLGVTFQARCLRRDKPKPLTPADLGPYSADDLHGEDEIKDWEPPGGDDDDQEA